MGGSINISFWSHNLSRLRQTCVTCLQQLIFLTGMKCFNFQKTVVVHGHEVNCGLYITFSICQEFLLLQDIVKILYSSFSYGLRILLSRCTSFCWVYVYLHVYCQDSWALVPTKMNGLFCGHTELVNPSFSWPLLSLECKNVQVPLILGRVKRSPATNLENHFSHIPAKTYPIYYAAYLHETLRILMIFSLLTSQSKVALNLMRRISWEWDSQAASLLDLCFHWKTVWEGIACIQRL